VPPNGTIERTKLQSWLNFFSSELHKGGLSPLFYRDVPEEGKDVLGARLVARFADLDQHLRTNEYLMWHNYSVADVHLFVVSNWASWANFDLSPYANVVSHRERVSVRTAVHSAMEAEGLIPWPKSRP
jgi:glutathione S-transferase